MKKTILVIGYWLVVIGLIIPSIVPLFRSDFFRMHDYTHAVRLQQLDKAIKDGDFPVRWVKDLGWGYGMPLFNFYAPLPYYLAEIFHLIGFSFVIAIKIIFGLTFFVSFIGMFLLAKKIWGKGGAFLSALAFVYSPYRALDFYVRGALGELVSISLIPLAIWSVFILIDKKDRCWLAIAGLINGLLFLSHTVLSIIYLPVVILFGSSYFLISKQKTQRFIYLISSLLIGLGLSAFFLLPAFFENTFTRVNVLTQGYSNYNHHFLYFRQFFDNRWGYGESVDGINDTISFQMGQVHLLLAGTAFIFTIFNIIKTKKIAKQQILTFVLAILFLLLAFLSTYHAKFIWDSLPLMNFIQFPWRLNSLLIVFISLLSGGSFFYIKKLYRKKIAFIFLSIAVLALIKANILFFRPEEFVNPQQYYYTDEESIKRSMSNIIPDYVPKWVQKEPYEIALTDYQVMAGDPKLKTIKSKTTKSAYEVNAQKPFTLQINRFYFPGFQILINNQKTSFTYEDNNGIIKTDLPAGNYQMVVKYNKTRVRLLSEILSLFSILTVIYLLTTSVKDYLSVKKNFHKNHG